MSLPTFLTILGGCLVALLVIWFPLRLLVDQAGRNLGNALSLQNLELRQRVLELERVRWLPIDEAPPLCVLILRALTVDGEAYVACGSYDIGYQGDPQQPPISEGWKSIEGDHLIPTHYIAPYSLLDLEAV